MILSVKLDYFVLKLPMEVEKFVKNAITEVYEVHLLLELVTPEYLTVIVIFC